MYNEELAWYNGINFTPSNTFNWTISYVKMNEYDMERAFPDSILITSATEHPLCDSAWFLYIWSWAKIDILDKTTWTVETVSIIDANYTIKAITELWNQYIIWATNGTDTKYYYWNGVDEQASEVITWKWARLTNAYTDGNISYAVIMWDVDYAKLYAVSGYERTMLTNYEYTWANPRTFEWYNPIKKNNFYLRNCNCLAVWNWMLYVPSYWWVYSYWHKIPFIENAWSKDIIHDITWGAIVYSMNYDWWLSYSYRKVSSGITYNTISRVVYYQNTTQWYLVTNPILRDNLSTEKALTKLKIWFKNVHSNYGNIKLYAVIDDNAFFTFTVSWVTITPTVWAVYKDNSTLYTMEVISTDITWWAGTITLRTLTTLLFDYFFEVPANIVKISWTWDATITTSNYTNMVLIKTIQSENQWYWSETIFSQSFIDTYMPNWRKLQLVIELNSSNTVVCPEVYDITILSDIVNNNV